MFALSFVVDMFAHWQLTCCVVAKSMMHEHQTDASIYTATGRELMLANSRDL